MPSDTPLQVALVGAGNRATNTYGRLVPHLGEWLKIVAVCDPVRPHADALAETLEARPFYSIHELLNAEMAEAALVVTPVPSHHSISSLLSSRGVHHNVETSMAETRRQGREMVERASGAGVVLRIGENFFRYPIDRMMKAVARTGAIGDVRRIICMYDHTGYHNNSRWIVFHEAHPTTAQAIAHRMPVAPYNFQPHRHYEEEGFASHFFSFPGGRLVVDLAGNIKGSLGRHPRPGYTEVAGARGTVVQHATKDWNGEAEVRVCSDEALANGGIADQIAPIVQEDADGAWQRSVVEIGGQTIEYRNPLPLPTDGSRSFYGAAVGGHIVDFVRAVWRHRGSREAAEALEAQGFEYTDTDALMAMEMEEACDESALRGGEELALPLAPDAELRAESDALERLRAKFGRDPMDIEAMLEVSYPRP